MNYTEAQLKEMLEDQIFLQCLREAGVDNWEGYDFACTLYRERDMDNDD